MAYYYKYIYTIDDIKNTLWVYDLIILKKRLIKLIAK